MAVNFPNAPNINDTTTVGGVTYKWDGTAWRSAGQGLQGLTGAQGTSGDRYASTSSTSVAIGTGSKSLTIGTGLALSATQVVRIVYDTNNYMEGAVTSYTPGSGALVVNVTSILGSGTYAAWTINLTGAVGATGAQGTQGIQGTTGTQGVQGRQGTTGNQGTQGIQGTTGTGGSQGTTGTTGSQGTQGIQGTTGTAGNNGSQGTQGIQGTTGAGTQGTQGVQGTTGSSGGTGSQGTQGIQGITGTGTQGVQGTTGTGSTNVNISAITSTDTTTYPVLVGAASTGDQAPFIDNADFAYNASTGVLTVIGLSAGSTGITSGGNVVPSANNSWFSGTSGALWARVYATDGYLTNIELGNTTDTTISRSSAGRVTVEGLELGYRRLPQVSTTGKTLTETDNGYHVYTSGGCTVPASVFTTGDAITIVNSSTGDITITQGSGATMYLAGTATTGNRTLAQKGICTVLCVESNTFIISGTGLT